MRLSLESFPRESSRLSDAGTTPTRRNGPGAFGPAGVGEQGQGTRGVPGNLGDPSVSTHNSGSGTGTSTPRSPRPRVEAAGSKLRRKGGIAKRRQRSAAKGTDGSRSAP